MKPRIVVFFSGKGTNLEAIIKATKNGKIDGEVIGGVCNNKTAGGLEILSKSEPQINSLLFCDYPKEREDFDKQLVENVKRTFGDFELIVLAGWMHVFTNVFISEFKNIINLHPALPGQFPGKSAIKDAFRAYKDKKVEHTGIMVHHVVEEVDAGKVVDQMRIPIFPQDTIDTLTDRIKYLEKPLFISAIQKTLQGIMNDTLYSTGVVEKPIHSGKVREIYDIGYNLLNIVHSDRLSSFDRHICDVPGKGAALNSMSAYWFDTTRHIVDNHMVHSEGNSMIVKKCTPFKVEVVVRGYITGNTSTSLWTHYAKGVREYCGITFPDGLEKHQKIPNVLTPTTKGEHDLPISAEQVVTMGLMTQEEWDFVSKKAMQLFAFGQDFVSKKGLILVDTKYEFGKDANGNILLIDELHTCDSSRYWFSDTYNERMKNGQDPQSLDKDRIRNYVKSVCDPYTDEIPEIPYEVISNTRSCYMEFYMILSLQPVTEFGNDVDMTERYFDFFHRERVVILSGSDSDKPFVDKIVAELDKNNIYSDRYVASAHKQTRVVLGLLDKYEKMGGKVVWVTVAGRSNALSGVVAANTRFPVIGCPPFKDKDDMMVNINSTIQCPSKVPVMTILEPGNVALSIGRMFGM